MKAFKTLVTLALILIPAFLFSSTWGTHLIVSIDTGVCSNCGACAESGYVTSDGDFYYFYSDPVYYYGDISTYDCYVQSEFAILRNMAEVCPCSAISYHSEQY